MTLISDRFIRNHTQWLYDSDVVPSKRLALGGFLFVVFAVSQARPRIAPSLKKKPVGLRTGDPSRSIRAGIKHINSYDVDTYTRGIEFVTSPGQ